MYFFDFVPRPAVAFFMEPCAIVVVVVVLDGGCGETFFVVEDGEVSVGGGPCTAAY